MGDPGPLPNRWLNCPQKSTGLIINKFIAFKTPLGTQFNEKVPKVNRFTPSMVFDYAKTIKMKLGLWIDLTNTSRFYDKKEVEKMDCKYVKMSCRGHGETPSLEQTRQFISIVNEFIEQNPKLIVGVHCTHGFNRTGFLITCYLVEMQDWSVDAALKEFADKREPGIYKKDYLDELYKRYDDDSMAPEAPPRPDWCEEEEIDYDDSDAPNVSANVSQPSQPTKSKRRRKETNYKKDFFMPIDGVEPFDTQPRLLEVQRKVQSFCKWTTTGFPGLQPVSMDRNNMKKLGEKPYMVSWKADGVRYMMLIDDENEVYMFDRDNCVFKINNLRFPHNKEPRHLRDTLLDGEMVVDHMNGQTRIRYLCYDIIRFEGVNVGKSPFWPVRLNCIDNEIIKPRNREIECGKLDKDAEPFRVVKKEFWDVSVTERLLGEEFAATLQHEPDGLIFQPSEEPYVPGPCPDVLKWKPSEMNSVDFRLKFGPAPLGSVQSMVPYLYLGQLDTPFAEMKYSKKLKQYDGKIIECKYDMGQWVMMRERTDKSFPNSYSTAKAVCHSIMYPVTKDDLLSYIKFCRFRPAQNNHMPPPAKRRR